jgi:hypothetical protein
MRKLIGPVDVLKAKLLEQNNSVASRASPRLCGPPRNTETGRLTSQKDSRAVVSILPVG